ncbi:hypothetical protein ACFLSI_07170, partial [Bacteroidota bacterium]
MTPFLLYLIKVGLAYSLCYLVFWTLFKKETFFKRNRLFLLMSIFIPLAIPFIHFPIQSEVTEMVSNQGKNLLFIISNTLSEQQASPELAGMVEDTSQTSFINLPSLFVIIYISGLLFFLFRIIINYSRIINLIRHSEKTILLEMILVITRISVSPFSFFKWLVIPEYKKKHPDLYKIIEHEMVHCRQNHSVDILLSELLIAFQWFNPFAWLLKSAITRNNEFIVDQELMSTNMNPKEYQYS